MTLSIAEQQDLMSRLIAQMGQGATSGNFIGAYGALEPPKQSDIAAFKAAAHPSGLQQSGDAEGGLPASQIDSLGNSKATAALAEIHNAGNAQQADRLGQNTLAQQGGDEVDKAEKNGKKALDDIMAAKLEKEKKKQDAINALISLIQGLQQKLQVLDIKISSAVAEQGSGIEGTTPDVGKLVAQRSKLVSQIEQLQQKLQSLLAS